MNIRNLFLTLCLFWFFYTAVNITFAQDPLADAVFEDLFHEYTLQPDGSITYRYAQALRLNTSFAFTRQYGESFIIYDPRFQKLDILRSETVLADGKTVLSPPNAFNEVLPQFAADCPPYVHLREMVVTHTGLEKNAVIHFEYRLSSQKNFYPAFSGKIPLAGRDPIRKMTVKIRIPSGTRLQYYMTSGSVEPMITKKGQWIDYTWSFTHIQLIHAEPGQPPLEQWIPYLYFSATEIKQIVAAILPDEKKMYALPQNIKPVIQAILKDKTYLKDRATALTDWVRKNVRTMNTDLSLLAHRARPAEDTYRDNSGSALDKAILLTAMCRSAGIEAFPAFISNRTDLVTESPSLAFLTTALVRINELDAWCDPSNPQHDAIPSNYYQRLAFILKKNPQFVFIKPETTGSLIRIAGKLEFDAQAQLSGKGEMETDGMYRYEWNPAGMTNLVRILNSGTTIQMNLLEKSAVFPNKQPARFPFELKGKLKLHESHQYFILNLPNELSQIQNLPLQWTARQTPILIPHPFTEIQEWTIQLPENLQTLAVPADTQLSNAMGQFLLQTEKNGQTLFIKRTLNLKQHRIEPEDYPLLFDLIKLRKDPASWMIMIAPKP